MERRNWTRDELVAVLALYYQMPFGRMHHRAPEVQAMSERVGRTPSAVAYKLVNFASFDPDLQSRGVKGMQNASKLDRQIWDEFHGQWTHLAGFEENLFSQIDHGEPENTVREATVQLRNGQSFFRRAVLSAYGEQCCITRISSSQLIRASHIIPWAHDESQRLNPSNGIALNALHDAAFDRGLITLDDDLRVVVSSDVRQAMPAEIYDSYFERYEGKAIHLPERFEPDREALAYHQQHVYQCS